MYAMPGAVIVVLLIACVNVMNMQFGRAALRSRELAIRGASGRLAGGFVRQMLTESFLIALLGAIVVVLAYWAVDLLAELRAFRNFSSLLDRFHDRRQSPWIHPRRGPLATLVWDSCPPCSQRADNASDNEGRRPRQEPPLSTSSPGPRGRTYRDDGARF